MITTIRPFTAVMKKQFGNLETASTLTLAELILLRQGLSTAYRNHQIVAAICILILAACYGIYLSVLPKQPSLQGLPYSAILLWVFITAVAALIWSAHRIAFSIKKNTLAQDADVSDINGVLARLNKLDPSDGNLAALQNAFQIITAKHERPLTYQDLFLFHAEINLAETLWSLKQATRTRYRDLKPGVSLQQ